MKTMKNVLMILLGAALVLSLAGVGAVAAGTTQATYTYANGAGAWDPADGGAITVSYTIGESYSVTIPPDVDLNSNKGVGQNVNVDAIVYPGKTLTISVESHHGWKMMMEGQDAGIPYTMTYHGGKSTITENSDGTKSVEIYTTDETVSGVSEQISFAPNAEDPTTLGLAAGKYTDTLTFTVKYE